jgi:EpsI family protein
MKSSWRFGGILGVLVATGLLVNAWSYLGEAHVNRKELKDFPKQIDNWQQLGGDQRFDDQTLSVLRASDYLLRNYKSANGQVANFYVGYYASQREGASYHSPLNCLPGSGWTMTDPGEVSINPANGSREFAANRYLIQNGEYRELMIYWYQGRGRAVASEYWGKFYTVLDSIWLRRSDAAMIRITVPVGKSEESARATAAELAGQISAVLPEFVPD